MNTFKDVRSEIENVKSAKRAKDLSRFFKTGKGEYGEGDQFAGLTVPQARIIAKQFRSLSSSETKKLLDSSIHEERLIALFILIYQFEKGDERVKKKLYDLYMANLKAVNNWDLVDLSTPKIVSMYLLDKPRGALYELAQSHNLWERRIAIMGTFAFILKNKE